MRVLANVKKPSVWTPCLEKPASERDWGLESRIHQGDLVVQIALMSF